MPKFQSRPKIIEAEQFTGKQPLPFRDAPACFLDADGWHVFTIHRQRTAIAEGDWIIMEPDGEHFYPCKPDIFAMNYNLIEE